MSNKPEATTDNELNLLYEDLVEAAEDAVEFAWLTGRAMQRWSVNIEIALDAIEDHKSKMQKQEGSINEHSTTTNTT